MMFSSYPSEGTWRLPQTRSTNCDDDLPSSDLGNFFYDYENELNLNILRESEREHDSCTTCEISTFGSCDYVGDPICEMIRENALRSREDPMVASSVDDSSENEDELSLKKDTLIKVRESMQLFREPSPPPPYKYSNNCFGALVFPVPATAVKKKTKGNSTADSTAAAAAAAEIYGASSVAAASLKRRASDDHSTKPLKATTTYVLLSDSSSNLICKLFQDSNKRRIVLPKSSLPANKPLKVMSVISSKRRKNVNSQTEVGFHIGGGDPVRINGSNVQTMSPLLVPVSDIIIGSDEILSEIDASRGDKLFHDYAKPTPPPSQSSSPLTLRLETEADIEAKTLRLVSMHDFAGRAPAIIPGNSPNDGARSTSYARGNGYNPGRFRNKAAENVDHDHGMNCRAPKTAGRAEARIFNVDSRGANFCLETPSTSASEPTTDGEEDEESSTSASASVVSVKVSPASAIRKRNVKKEIFSHNKVCKELASVQKARNAAGKKKDQKERKPAARKAKPKSDTNKRKKGGGGGRVFSPSERQAHNTNEQNRRIAMRLLLDAVRQAVPSLVDKPRAAKVAILQAAKVYVEELHHEELKLEAREQALHSQMIEFHRRLWRLKEHARNKFLYI